MTPFAILPIVTFLLNLAVGSYVLGQRKSDPVNRAFLLLSLSTAGWLGMHLLLYIPEIWGVHRYVYIIQSVFWIPLGLLFLNFAYALAGRKKDTFFKIGAIITLLCNAAYLNVDWFLMGFKQLPWGIIQVYRPIPHTLASCVSGALAGSGLFIIAKKRRHAGSVEEKKIIDLILIGGLITIASTLAANVALPVYLGVSDHPRYGSSAAVIFIVIVFLAVKKYRFLTISVEGVANELFEDINDGVLLVTAGGVVRRENAAIRNMLQRSVLGLTADDVLPGVVLTDDVVNQAVEVDAGDKKRVLSISSSTSTQSGREIGKIVIVRDITELKEAEAVLRRSRDDLEKEVEKRTAELRHAQRMEAIGTFTGAIAHDFNNLLAAILGFAHAARVEVGGNPNAAADIEEIAIAGKRAREIIRQLLTFSRPDSDIQFQNISVCDVVDEALKLLRISLPSSIRTEYDLDCNAVIRCDPVQISQVIMNLTTNAFHALKGRAHGTFRMVLRSVSIDAAFAEKHPPLKPGPHIKLDVSDTGHGMDADILEQIFDPFFTTKSSGEGTGLGLSTSLGIVRNHGGAILVESELDKGTTFTIYLPQAAASPSSAPRDSEPSLGGTEHLLVVDDEEQLVRLMKRLLEPLGYRVTGYSSSPEALEAVLQSPKGFDLILTDYTMPDLSGVEVAEAILGHYPELPVILMSGYGEKLDMEAIRASGIKAFLKKPVPVGELAKTIRAVLDGPE